MAGSLVVMARQSPLNGGTTVSGAQLFVYNAGTATKRAVYTTSALAVQLSNPVVADSNGRLPAVWVDPAGGAYKIVIAPSGDSDPPTSPFWTEDNIPVPGDVQGDVNATVQLVIDNDNNGTANAARLAVSSGDANAALFVSGSGRTSALVTGGPTGAQSVLRTLGAHPLIFAVSNTYVGGFDNSSTATHTRLLIYDVDSGQVERVTVGAADSGGSGFKLLRIPN